MARKKPKAGKKPTEKKKDKAKGKSKTALIHQRGKDKKGKKVKVG